jgi:hypothetical protein
MAHMYLPDELIDKVRPLCETAWEKEQREEKKKVLSPTDVVMRILQRAYDSGKKGRSI